MKHLLLTVGKPKQTYLAQGIDDYLARLKPYGGGSLVGVRPAKLGPKTPDESAKAEEGQRLLARLDQRDLVWALEIKGKAWSSLQWAKALEKARLSGRSRLVLVIGGALGLDPAVARRADQLVSFGPPTLAHELAALVAAEQLYRACTILAGLPYHRA
ncbi:23S rRNA (pseudouridine(1915)-N(3))-methyltransferase RlmH [Desulfoferula mesophila]|uniref:Ribosomal RNA large subunit methyltransferase H n=1 Tax=Desulfoferula mesophila TaxID=3058419 RepID=A0AAU9EET1_9BACT|nr:ribosomal RNA large subunit methyltransferase H [Desulfoferula mesophilus]